MAFIGPVSRVINKRKKTLRTEAQSLSHRSLVQRPYEQRPEPVAPIPNAKTLQTEARSRRTDPYCKTLSYPTQLVGGSRSRECFRHDLTQPKLVGGSGSCEGFSPRSNPAKLVGGRLGPADQAKSFPYDPTPSKVQLSPNPPPTLLAAHLCPNRW